jgi:hypothetical protein
VTRKQAATILGKGDGGNIVTLCKHGGVRMIQIPYGTKTTAMFWGEDVVRLFAKMDKKNRPKQTELPTETIGFYQASETQEGAFFTPPHIQRIVEDLVRNESEMMESLGRIEAMLTALLKR